MAMSCESLSLYAPVVAQGPNFWREQRFLWLNNLLNRIYVGKFVSRNKE